MFCCAFFLRHLKGKLVTRLTFPSFFPRLLQLPLAESDASDSHWLLYRSERVMRHTAGSCRVGVCNCYCEGSVRASPADNITATSCEGGATGADSEFVLVGGIWTPSSLYANDRDTNTCLNADKLNPPNLHPSLIVPSKKNQTPPPQIITSPLKPPLLHTPPNSLDPEPDTPKPPHPQPLLLGSHNQPTDS